MNKPQLCNLARIMGNPVAGYFRRMIRILKRMGPYAQKNFFWMKKKVILFWSNSFFISPKKEDTFYSALNNGSKLVRSQFFLFTL